MLPGQSSLDAGKASRISTMDQYGVPSPPPLQVIPQPVSRSAPFSVHSRGVQLFDQNRCFDCQYVGLSIFRSLRDISGALWTFLLVQGWLSVWVTIITIVSVFFFTYIGGGKTQAIDWTVAAFVVLLPLVGNLWWAFARRERALADLAQGAHCMSALELSQHIDGSSSFMALRCAGMPSLSEETEHAPVCPACSQGAAAAHCPCTPGLVASGGAATGTPAELPAPAAYHHRHASHHVCKCCPYAHQDDWNH